MGDVIVELFSLIAARKLRVIVGQTFPLSKAADAHRAMLARTTTGKIVLDPSA
jgi:NADPH2:quinone reductase